MFKFAQFDSDEVRGFRGLPYSRFKEDRRLAAQAGDPASAVRVGYLRRELVVHFGTR